MNVKWGSNGNTQRQKIGSTGRKMGTISGARVKAGATERWRGAGVDSKRSEWRHTGENGVLTGKLGSLR